MFLVGSTLFATLGIIHSLVVMNTRPVMTLEQYTAALTPLHTIIFLNAAMLAYFYITKRVQSVFKAKNWGEPSEWINW